MSLHIYNTLTQKKEVFENTGKEVRMFVCGPTVYGYVHIGNAATCVSFDIIVRYLRFVGFNIFYIQNITDIDDKIIKRAHEENVEPLTLANQYADVFLKDMEALGVASPQKYPLATDYIPQIVEQVQTLIQKGFAYKIDDGYYYDISKFLDYGKLAKRTVEQADDGVSRIDLNPQKRNKGDFCLWKFSKEGEPSWETVLGKGRPGWHIEDTAITQHFFGPQYEIHGGGTDLVFPHHEAEIAQQEAASGKKPFVKFWMHAGMVQSAGRKMSKSLGNFITLRDFLQEHSPLLFRWMVLNRHYRSTIDLGEEAIFRNYQSLRSIETLVQKLGFVEKNSKLKTSFFASFFAHRQKEEIDARIYQKQFHEAMEDDFNTPRAVAILFEYINALQPRIWNLTPRGARRCRIFILDLLNIFGISFDFSPVSQGVQKIAEERELSRVNQQFVQADDFRKKIEGLGYEVEDTPLGPFLKKSER